jgi:3-hydroxyacyl-[acyl-carrier-protein] dehydratase
MRFVFVDRIVALDVGRSIETVKNVSASEDIFTDHFPDHPVFPGALIVESFEQAAQLLIAETYGFARLGRLRRLSRVAFRRLVRPGDTLQVRCERRDADERAWTVAATAQVGGRPVATAVLVFALEEVAEGPETAERGARLRRLMGTLRDDLFEASGAGTLA